MFWLRRPPYSRWIAAGLVVCCGIFLDTRSTPVVSYPFAAAPIAVGETVDEIAWRDVPVGVLPDWTTPVTGAAVTEIPAGTPLVPSLVADVTIPPGWWAVSLPLPQRVAPGTPIRVALDGDFADGIVAGGLTDNGYETTGPVAFPPDQASRIAQLAANSGTVVMIGSDQLAE